MEVSYSGGRFVARCTYVESIALRQQHWDWDATAKRWFTTDPAKARKWVDACTPDAAQVIQAFAMKQSEVIEKSYAIDTTAEFPVPDGVNPGSGKPYAYLGYQKAGIEYAMPRRYTLIADAPGLGKGHPITTRVLTPTGWRCVGDLEVGDRICGRDGETFVTGTHDRGVLPVYRITTNDGYSVLVDADHLHSVWDPVAEEWTTITTVEALARIMRNEKIVIPLLISAPEQPVRAFQRDPYHMGIQFAKPSKWETVDLPARPERYSQGSVFQRKNFLTGILRGHADAADKDDHLAVYVRDPMKNAAWVEEIRQTILSLGGLAFYTSHNDWHLAHIAVYLPEELYALVGKGTGNRFKRVNRLHMPERTILDVTPVGRDFVRCISVAAEDQLYVTEHFIVTHNTIQAIGVSNAMGKERCPSVLVTCPATLKLNWRREFERWTTNDYTVGVCHSRARSKTETVNGVKVVRKWTENVWPSTDVVILNYEQHPTYHDEVRRVVWGMHVVDEAQALMSEDSDRTRHIIGGPQFIKKTGIGKNIKRVKKPAVTPVTAVKHVFLSGTPMMKRPVDMWPMIKKMDPNGLGKDFLAFAYRYCAAYTGQNGLDTRGASNLDELQDHLRSTFMVRRLKSQVLTDLPPKIRSVVEFPAEGIKRYVDEESSVVAHGLAAFEAELEGLSAVAAIAEWGDCKASLDTIDWDSYADKASAVPVDEKLSLSKLAQARQELALAKLPMCVDWINRLLENDEKVIVFAYHKRVIKALLEAYPGCAHISGLVPIKKRQAEVDRFQTDESCRVFVGQIQAAGTGVTLTKSHHVIFVEESWIPAELEQAEDRAHRIGQLDCVNVWHLVIEGSLDCRMIWKVMERQQVIAQALDRAA